MKLTGDRLIGGLLCLFTCIIFLASPVKDISDSKYTILVSERLLHDGRFDLDPYRIPGLDPVPAAAPGVPTVYQIQTRNGHRYHFFPPGSAVLSVPFVAVMNAAGISAATDDRTYNRRGEKRIQVTLAALLMAALTGLVFVTSRLLLPTGWSVAIALGTALGTQVWSTASRALWSDTWGMLLMAAVVYLLLAQETGRRRINPVLLASLLAWSYFARPTNSVPIVAVTAYLLLFHRRLFIAFALTGAVWLAGFVAYSWHHFGQALPDYYLAGRLEFRHFWMALAANLVSPSRGLLVFVPALAFVGYLLIRYARTCPTPRLVALSLCVAAAHLIAISGLDHWWAGYSYGPRFTTGLVPWFALLAILGVAARQTWLEEPRPATARRWPAVELALGAALLAGSVDLHRRGATRHDTQWWNLKPVCIDAAPERVWDWSRPQFAGWRGRRRGRRMSPGL